MGLAENWILKIYDEQKFYVNSIYHRNQNLRNMKFKALLTLFLVTAVSLVTIQKSTAQEIDLGTILEAGTADANTYMEAYSRPAILSFANGMANGWYNTAKPHKLLGLDVTFSLNIANIPDEEKLFNFNDLNWENLQLQGDPNLPTLVGGETTSSSLVIPAGVDLGNGFSYDASQTFPALNGLNLEDSPVTGVPVPTLNFGVGLIKNTDLKIRWIPEQNFDDFSVRLFGIGVMHDIKQWIPGMKLVPIDISGFVAYTSFNSEFDINISDATFSGQGVAEFNASATTIQVVASKKLAVLTPYVGLGFNAVSADLAMNGTYTLQNSTTDQLVLTDPVALEFTDGGGPRFTVGARLKLLVLTIHADYTAQKYSSFTMGLGLSIR